MEKPTTLDYIAFVLVIIGAINWGLVGLFSLNLVEVLLGWSPLLERLVYIVVGLAGIYLIYYLARR